MKKYEIMKKHGKEIEQYVIELLTQNNDSDNEQYDLCDNFAECVSFVWVDIYGPNAEGDGYCDIYDIGERILNNNHIIMYNIINEICKILETK